MFLKQKIIKFLTFMLLVLFMTLIVIFPDISNGGVTCGLMISANIIIPSLFPFMVCVLMLIKRGLHIKNYTVNKILHLVFGHDFEMFFIFLLSLIGGYPIGARLINELYNKKAITHKAANIMLFYCVNAGPPFVISAVGYGVFKSKIIGVVLLASHISTSVLMAVLCSRALKREIKINNTTNIYTKNFSDIFVESVADASAAMLQICSFIIIFSSISAYLDFFLGNVPIIRYISYLTEVTSAITKTKNIMFVSFLLGFSGVSIWCQIFAMTSKIKIKVINFIFGRVMHGIISVFITRIIITVFDIKLSTFSNKTTIINKSFYSDTSITISLAIMLIMFMVFIYTKNSSGKILKDVI